MKKPLIMLAVLALVLVLVAFRPSPDVSTTNVFKYKGQGVYALFFSTDPSGCIHTSIELFGLTDVLRPAPGVRDPISEVYVSLDQYDECTGSTRSASGAAPLSNSNFKINGNFESARLATTVSLYDWNTASFFDVSLDLTWDGTSDVSRRNTHEVLTFVSCHYNRTAKEDVRYAVVTGTISDETTNFAPDPSAQAYIFNAKTGQFWHDCQ